jgi:hypothetical protein
MSVDFFLRSDSALSERPYVSEINLIAVETTAFGWFAGVVNSTNLAN